MGRGGEGEEEEGGEVKDTKEPLEEVHACMVEGVNELWT